MIHSQTQLLRGIGLLATTYIGCIGCADRSNQRAKDATDVGSFANSNSEAPAADAEAFAQSTEQDETRSPGTLQSSTARTPGADTIVRPEGTEQVRAAFTSANGYDLRGEAEFTQVSQGVEVRVAVVGATPGVKGVHIHQKADCSDIPNKSMGAHFSPKFDEASYPAAADHELGDLGHMQIGADGAGELKVVVPAANLRPDDSHSFLTRSIVLHESSETEGSGEAERPEKPIACGIIDR